MTTTGSTYPPDMLTMKPTASGDRMPPTCEPKFCRPVSEATWSDLAGLAERFGVEVPEEKDAVTG